MPKIIKLLKSLDLFAESPSLTLFKKKKFSTLTGFFTTLSLLTVLFLFSFSKISSVINRSNAYLESDEKVDFNTPPIDMRHRFALSLSPDYLNNLGGIRYFDFFIAIRATLSFQNGTKAKISNEFRLIPCQHDHFPMFDQDSLDSFGINKWLCPNFTDSNLDFHVKGTYGEEVYKFLELGIVKCSNSSKFSNYDANTSCATDPQLEALKKIKLYYNLIIVNNLINLDNFEKPFSSYVENLQSLFKIGENFVQKEYYLNHAEIQSDLTQSMNLFRSESNIIKETSLSYDGKFDDFKVDEYQYRLGVQMFADIFIRSSKKNKTYLRKYDTFQDFLETAGSFYSILVLIFAFINSQLTKNHKLKEIAFALYDFSENTAKRKSSIFNSEFFRFLPFSFLIKMKNFIFFRQRKKKKEFGNHSVQDIESQLNFDLDIIAILMKLRKLENFKKVMINQDQDLVLELTGRDNFEKIVVENKISSIHKFKTMEKNNKILKLNNMDLLSKFDQAYSNLESDVNNDISHKICKLVRRNFNSKQNSTKKLPNLNNWQKPPVTNKLVPFFKK